MIIYHSVEQVDVRIHDGELEDGRDRYRDMEIETLMYKEVNINIVLISER